MFPKNKFTSDVQLEDFECQKHPNVQSLLEKRNLRVPEFSRLYGISRSKTYLEMKSGRLKFFKCGTVTLISKEAAETWQNLLEKSKVDEYRPGGE